LFSRKKTNLNRLVFFRAGEVRKSMHTTQIYLDRRPGRLFGVPGRHNIKRKRKKKSVNGYGQLG